MFLAAFVLTFAASAQERIGGLLKLLGVVFLLAPGVFDTLDD